MDRRFLGHMQQEGKQQIGNTEELIAAHRLWIDELQGAHKEHWISSPINILVRH